MSRRPSYRGSTSRGRRAAAYDDDDMYSVGARGGRRGRRGGPVRDEVTYPWKEDPQLLEQEIQKIAHSGIARRFRSDPNFIAGLRNALPRLAVFDDPAYRERIPYDDLMLWAVQDRLEEKARMEKDQQDLLTRRSLRRQMIAAKRRGERPPVDPLTQERPGAEYYGERARHSPFDAAGQGLVEHIRDQIKDFRNLSLRTPTARRNTEIADPRRRGPSFQAQPPLPLRPEQQFDRLELAIKTKLEALKTSTVDPSVQRELWQAYKAGKRVAKLHQAVNFLPNDLSPGQQQARFENYRFMKDSDGSRRPPPPQRKPTAMHKRQLAYEPEIAVDICEKLLAAVRRGDLFPEEYAYLNSQLTLTFQRMNVIRIKRIRRPSARSDSGSDSNRDDQDGQRIRPSTNIALVKDPVGEIVRTRRIFLPTYAEALRENVEVFHDGKHVKCSIANRRAVPSDRRPGTRRAASSRF